MDDGIAVREPDYRLAIRPALRDWRRSTATEDPPCRETDTIVQLRRQPVFGGIPARTTAAGIRSSLQSAAGAPEVSVAAKKSRLAILRLLAGPFAALCYPFLLELFHLEVIRSGGASVLLSSLLLLLAVAVPFVGIYAYSILGMVGNPSAREVRARILALFFVGTPPLFTALGVVLTMLQNPISDLVAWVILWTTMTAAALVPRRADFTAVLAKPRLFPRLRFAHGVSAAAIVLIFLALHLVNHLAGLWSADLHRTLMSQFRHVYRARLVEPILVTLLLFQVTSGPILAWQYAKHRVGSWRALQVASGVYLFFYLLSHMNSVFIYARAYAGIQTDWNFATGAPTGLLRDAWNIRLLPHYLLGVFFVLTHLVLGARIIALAHDIDVRTVNRLAITGIALAAAVATSIMLGMVGIHIGR